MNKILVDNKEFIFTAKNLPTLIHGEEKSGASSYTITLAANLYSQGSRFLFLCGYPMAQEDFIKQAGKSDDTAMFFIKEQVKEFKKALTDLADIEERIIILKNIELFSEDIFDLVSQKTELIVSGNINQCSYMDKILEKSFAAKILFSELNGYSIPDLKIFEGFFISDNLQGKTSIQL